jgi:hypothetical protein
LPDVVSPSAPRRRWVLVVVLTLSQILLYGALAEAYRDIRQLRLHVGAVDESLPVDLGVVAGGRPSDHGLAAVLDSVTSALVLLVDRRCSTCNLLVEYFAGRVPAGVWLVAIAADDVPLSVIAGRLSSTDAACRG